MSHELAQGKAVNAAQRQQAKPSPSLPAAAKPALPANFVGKIDGTSVSRFGHQFDVYFNLVELTDDIKQS